MPSVLMFFIRSESEHQPMFGLGNSQPKLILASKSPRRAEILRHAGFAFYVHATHVDESLHSRESPRAYVLRLARAKARHAADQMKRKSRTTIVVGADTVILVRGRILGKPSDVKEARRMLRLLSGRTHQVLTGVSVLQVPAAAGADSAPAKELHHVETTRVRFLKLSNHEIDDYIATGEPFDKAGGYAIQGIAGRFVTLIEGCYFNVMGLPLSCLWSMLRTLGYAGKINATTDSQAWLSESPIKRLW